MSDLQCAATVVVLGPTTASPALLAQLRERRVALVYAGGGPGTTAPAAALAGALGVAARTTDGDDARPGGAGGLALAAVLDALADEHRGECVVLVVAEGTLAGLGEHAGLAGRAGSGAAPGVVVELDDDGRRLSPLPTAR